MLAINHTLWLERGFLNLMILLDRHTPELKSCHDVTLIAALSPLLFASAQKSLTHRLTMQFRTGAEEIIVAVHFLREPIYVVDVFPTRWSMSKYTIWTSWITCQRSLASVSASGN